MRFVSGLSRVVTFESGHRPRLVVLIDAEEEFQWHTYSPTATSVQNIAQQCQAQAIFEKHGVCPTYLVDYPVAAQAEGFEPLNALAGSKKCTIGAQLHPWVNPPIDEQITVRHTYAGNLPEALERAKVENLTNVIIKNFGVHPKVFRTGRWGAGPRTAAIVKASGYEIDSSVMPLADFSWEGGPDYSASRAWPYWVDGEGLLELPPTVGLLGVLEGLGSRGIRALLSEKSGKLGFPAILSRLGLLERIRLTPEGTSVSDAVRLTEALLRQGQRIFVLSYHSSSLLAGGTPYSTDAADVRRLLHWLEEYLHFFFGVLGGEPTTAQDIYAAAVAT